MCFPPILIPACNSSSPACLMLCSVYKLNKQGDSRQPCRTPFSILNQSAAPYRVLTCFWTCIQVSQEAGKTVWSHLSKSFSQFVICWHYECKTLMASSFRDLNSSAGISLYPLALSTAVFLNARLISHSRTSGSVWLTTPSQQSGPSQSFLYGSSVHSFRLFLISSELLGLCCFYPLLCPPLGGKLPWCFHFSWRDL